MKLTRVVFLLLIIVGITLCIVGCVNYANTPLCTGLCAIGVAVLILDQKMVDYL